MSKIRRIKHKELVKLQKAKRYYKRTKWILVAKTGYNLPIASDGTKLSYKFIQTGFMAMKPMHSCEMEYLKG